MTTMKLTFLGSSDAFGSGGRLQTAFHVAHAGGEFLIDCGATTLLGLEREGLDPNRIGHIFITHLHGDHFAGLVWWLIHANHMAGRTAPLTITGPVGIEARFNAAVEALYPGASATPRAYALSFLEYRERQPLITGGVTVTPFEVSHPSGAPPYALRIEAGGKIVTFSGDTEWVESLLDASRGADLFIAECFGYDRPVRYHMDWRVIERNLPAIDAKLVVLTHMGPEMLKRQSEISAPRVMLAYDGLKIVL